jgi:hypothetical protein
LRQVFIGNNLVSGEKNSPNPTTRPPRDLSTETVLYLPQQFEAVNLPFALFGCTTQNTRFPANWQGNSRFKLHERTSFLRVEIEIKNQFPLLKVDQIHQTGYENI